MNRQHYIDNLRILLTILVIFHHTAIGYGAMGGWCYVTPERVSGISQLILSSVLVVNQAFFMSLFFFVSALFMPPSLEKKGTGKYLMDRFIRLGIPLVFVMFILNPTLLYGIARHTNTTESSLVSYDLMIIKNYLNTSVMWFVLALLVFETLYVLYKSISKTSFSNLITDKFPTTIQIMSFTIISGLIAFAIRTFYPIGKNFLGLQFGYFALYTTMYCAGILASKKGWLEKMSLKDARKWLLAIIVIFPVIEMILIHVTKTPSKVASFQGGFNYKALFLAVWEAFTCVGLCYFLLALFKNKLNITSKWSSLAASDSYTVYIFHPVAVVAFTILLERIQVFPAVKFIFAFILSVTACFLFARGLRLIPGVKRVL